jgi:hypothetical protein
MYPRLCIGTTIRENGQGRFAIVARWGIKKQKNERLYSVRQMLIRRSQLQPVTIAAAAGGKRIATCEPFTNLFEQTGFLAD